MLVCAQNEYMKLMGITVSISDLRTGFFPQPVPS